MAASAQSARTHCITLNASAQLVCEYLGKLLELKFSRIPRNFFMDLVLTDYAISSILFQRGIFPHYRFNSTTFYGSGHFFKLKGRRQNWIRRMLWQIEEFIIRKQMVKFTIVIYNTTTLESLEWWEFVVDDVQEKNGGTAQQGKPLKRIHSEIREVMRQITATVSCLPFLDLPCDFDFAVQFVPGTIFPPGWMPCGVIEAIGPEENLKSFGTGYHNVSTSVYCKEDNEDM